MIPEDGHVDAEAILDHVLNIGPPQAFDNPFLVWQIGNEGPVQAVTEFYFWWRRNLWPNIRDGVRFRISVVVLDRLKDEATRPTGDRKYREDPTTLGKLFAFGIPVDPDIRMPDDEIHLTFNN